MRFKEWLLKEMPLQYYGHEFHTTNDPDEGFNKDRTQAIKRTTQVSVESPWGPPEIETIDDSKLIDDRFSRRDKILVTRPKTIKTLEDKLRISEYNFIILLVEKDSKKGIYEEQIQQYLHKNKIDRTDSIVFAKNASSGHLLSPWMILHTLGHALLTSPHIGIQATWDLSKVLHQIRIAAADKEDIPLNQEDLKNIFSFKSLTYDKFPLSNSELEFELVAEYLWNGKIRVNPQVSSFKNSRQIVSDIKRLESIIKSCLDRCVGKIIFDFS